MSQSTSKQPTYGIGTVSKLTGITTYTLRMWERRYGTVVADRAPNGRRIYQTRDVEKLALLKALTDRGTAISTVANLSLEELGERVRKLELIKAPTLPDEVRVAVLGAFLPIMLEADVPGADLIATITTGSDLRRFRADVRRLQPDVLVLEVAVLDDAAVEQITSLVTDSQARHALVVYGFGRSTDIQRLQGRDTSLLRSPVTPNELVNAIISAATGAGPKARRGGRRSEASHGDSGRVETQMAELPPHRYTPEQLSRLGRLDTTIVCECPKHLADILHTLGAFELYSQDCEDREPEDAALHAYLHACTANARSLMEDALARVIEMEKLQV